LSFKAIRVNLINKAPLSILMTLSIDEMATFCKKKGFVYPTSEIYGGFSGFFDFGHLGVELENNIKRELWKAFVESRDDVVGMDGAIIAHPKVWEASGHVTSFEDVMVMCHKCHFRARADTFIEEKLNRAADGLSAKDMAGIIKSEGLSCPNCKSELKEPTDFNLMLKTSIGSSKDSSAEAFLRPETAQLIFTNFRLVFDNARLKLPCGIAQAGKAFRNEISPRDFLFRTREFEGSGNTSRCCPSTTG